MPLLHWVLIVTLVCALLLVPSFYWRVRWRNTRRGSLALVEEQHQLINFLTTARLIVAALRDAHRDGATDASALSLAGAWIEQVDKYTGANEERRLDALAALHRAEDGR